MFTNKTKIGLRTGGDREKTTGKVGGGKKKKGVHKKQKPWGENRVNSKYLGH